MIYWYVMYCYNCITYFNVWLSHAVMYYYMLSHMVVTYVRCSCNRIHIFIITISFLWRYFHFEYFRWLSVSVNTIILSTVVHSQYWIVLMLHQYHSFYIAIYTCHMCHCPSFHTFGKIVRLTWSSRFFADKDYIFSMVTIMIPKDILTAREDVSLIPLTV